MHTPAIAKLERLPLKKVWPHEKRDLTPQSLNGVPHDLSCQQPPSDCPMVTFCDESRDAAGLFRSDDLFFKEMACLRGLDAPSANTWALCTAFDRDDDLVFDMQQLMEASS